MNARKLGRRLAAAITATWISTAAAHDDPAVRGGVLNHDTAERSLAAAEWLAAQADAAAAQAPPGSSALDKVGWLLWRAGGTDGDGEAAFAAELVAAGYEGDDWAISQWMEEMTALLAAFEATQGEARSAAEIEAELNSLPIVPLDEEGEREFDRLLAELDRATIPPHNRDLAAGLAPRIEAVLAAAGEAAP